MEHLVHFHKHHFLLFKLSLASEKYSSFISSIYLFHSIPARTPCICFPRRNANVDAPVIAKFFLPCVHSPISRFFTIAAVFGGDSVGDLSERTASTCVKGELLHGVSRRAERSWKAGAEGYEDLRDVDKQLQTERGIIALSFPSLQARRSSLLEEDPLPRHYASKPGLPVCSVASNSVP
ncbi:hypothetical protein K0M31_005899 [Melipona bicolor]|uniref:Uncharacterized protein n=1 Tax=Melipona bicolor TaxID=60889 RepID=A0AA40FVC3_9HYME|nr:hypothetical protein K0M31_005899 [Melipona bicolor]